MTDLAQASKAFDQAAQKSTTLYELSAVYLRLLDVLDDPEADPAAIETELNLIGGKIAQKAEAIAGLVRQCEGIAKMRRFESKRMADGAKSFERKAAHLRDYLHQHMRAVNQERIETGRFTISIKSNPPRVEVLRLDEVPNEFRRETLVVELDKKAILEHTRLTGEVVPGTEVVRGERLDIR